MSSTSNSLPVIIEAIPTGEYLEEGSSDLTCVMVVLCLPHDQHDEFHDGFVKNIDGTYEWT